MLSFTLTGTVGRIRSGADELELAIASCRLHGQDNDVHWVVCVARDQLLRASVVRQLSAGSIVRIEGEIEPRRREIKGVAFYDVVFVAKSFEALEPELASPQCGEARP
jgi:hypothetical protein